MRLTSLALWSSTVERAHEMDHDALWVCSEHRARLDGEPMGHAEEDKPVERISIVGEWDDGMAVRADALVFLDGNVQIWARA